MTATLTRASMREMRSISAARPTNTAGVTGVVFKLRFAIGHRTSHDRKGARSTDLKKAHPELDDSDKSRFTGNAAIQADSGFDTHFSNYRNQALLQQETFGLVDSLIKTPHPTKSVDKLGDHAHILVVSDFCRTPQINIGMGRDHYPNNSALVVSSRFKRKCMRDGEVVRELLKA
jgi:uncharacterized protein (DUF1501 family)